MTDNPKDNRNNKQTKTSVRLTRQQSSEMLPVPVIERSTSMRVKRSPARKAVTGVAKKSPRGMQKRLSVKIEDSTMIKP